jgi:ribosomal-protein-alanine N-acetyltransferase
MELETERLIIREFEFTDWIDVHAYASNYEVIAHMLWGPNTEEETQAFIIHTIDMRRHSPRVDYEFAVTLKSSGKLIGGAGIHASNRQGEIGYCFHPDYWKKGYASEAALEILKFGFGELALHRIHATCRPDNIGSASVMKKIGMTYEGHLREHMFYKGKWHDSFQYSILEHEFNCLCAEDQG